MFTTNIPQPRINSYNFAVNHRVYEPRNQKPYKPLGSFNNNNYTWKPYDINGDTAMGMPWVH